MTSIRRRLGTTWRSFAKEPNLGRFGSVWRAPSIANGLSSTLPLMRERSFWREINGGSAVCCGIWMISSKILLKMIHFVKSILNGLILVEVGRKHLWLKFMDKIGRGWLGCRVDGCNYGMKDSTGQHFIRKKWLIKTNDESFHKTFKAKNCRIPLPYLDSRTRDVSICILSMEDGSINCPSLETTVGFRSKPSTFDHEGGLQVFQWLASRLWRSRSCPRPLSLWSSITLWRPEKVE